MMSTKPMVVARIVYNNLPKLSDEARQRASVIVRNAAFEVEAYAKQVVPVDTGNLRNSIHTTMEGELTAKVGTHVGYAAYVEFGTRWMAPRPYLIPAVERIRPHLVDRLKKIVE